MIEKLGERSKNQMRNQNELVIFVLGSKYLDCKSMVEINLLVD
jgi:hypothetical protein